ncbi:uncharacterized protein EV422DRAFT_87782 [Fimicolochytrium jonesii]|uniref:uncharacterized protein n=1 Tax=Fimicolochytrium jonesii TaxID=1396493 RepID=UPI0022FECA34|nr:uncharacterized protein EV422DRAFT_87782 [Fimicolochytrium jonesii]KAI8819835.1 hypothetical protein EV422DRAFT_87782 [Fimicolochytrium jonesii]
MMWYDQSVDGEFSSVAVHPAFPVIAAATKEGRVELYDDEGKKQEGIDVAKAGAGEAKLAWHAVRKLLAVGWGNGSIAIWFDNEQVLREGNVHQSSISLVEWNPVGNKLITGDEDGDVVVWKVDLRGRLAVSCQYRLKNKVTHCLFRPSQLLDVDLRNVSSPPFFLGTVTGSIFYADDMGHCTESMSTSAPIAALLMLEQKDTVIVVTTNMLVFRLLLTPDGKLTQESQMKLSSAASKSDAKSIHVVWAGPSTLALSVGGQPIWIWDIENEENYVLNMSGTEKVRINCVAFSSHQSLLVAGTDSGHVVIWKGRINQSTDEEKGRTQVWEMLSKTNTGGSVEDVSWGVQSSVLAVRKRGGLKLLTRQVMHRQFWGRNAAIQVEQSRVLLYPRGKDPISCPVDMRIKGLALARNRFAVWNGHSIEIQTYDAGPLDRGSASDISGGDYAISSSREGLAGTESGGTRSTISTTAMQITIDDQFVYIGQGNRVEVCNSLGVAKGVISWIESEGDISGIISRPAWLCLTTSNKYLKLVDTKSGQFKQVLSKKVDPKLSLHSIHSARVNADGSMICYTGDKLLPGAGDLTYVDPRIHVYDVERDTTLSFDLTPYGGAAASYRWDWNDPKILVCQTGRMDDKPETASRIVSFFVTHSHGLTHHSTHPAPASAEGLLGVNMPSHYHINKASLDKPGNLLLSVPAPDLEGLENADPATLKSMLEFSFHLATGNVNESIRSLQHVRNPSTWRTLAKLCIKTRRPDIAAICFANMGDNRAVAELERVQQDGSGEEVALAIGAMFLGMEGEVEASCTACERWDILNRFYQATNRWEKALQIAATKDRIHLKTTFYNFARWLEEIGDFSGALAAFEKSGCESFEVPRLLLSNNDVKELEKYITGNKSKLLKKWWAQYSESHNNLKGALQNYEAAGDTLSVVRIFCLTGEVDKAVEIAQRANDKAALCHIAQHYSSEHKIAEAIRFYGLSTHLRPAIRLAKDNNMVTHLTSLALQASPDCLLDVAKYFEAKNMGDRAAVLYLKAGSVAKAVDVGLRAGDVGELVRNLPPDTDPAILEKLSNYYQSHDKPSEALHLLLLAKRFDQALALIDQHQIPLTEELIEAIPLTDSAEDKALLVQIADACMAQQQWALACKKYTQAGDRLRAMDALLRSGDTDKIIFFANVSGAKDRQIYVMASNYLQTLQWRNVPTYLKSIITFYTKARAWEHLASFYESCAAVEVDEFQNYEKALGALKEAIKVIDKIKDPQKRDHSLHQFESKVSTMAQFVHAREIAKTDTLLTFQICEQLLQMPDIDDAIRKGDIYALLIELHFSNGYYPQALDLLNRMEASLPGVNVAYYVDERIIQALRGDRDGNVGGEVVEENISVLE